MTKGPVSRSYITKRRKRYLLYFDPERNRAWATGLSSQEVGIGPNSHDVEANSQMEAEKLLIEMLEDETIREHS